MGIFIIALEILSGVNAKRIQQAIHPKDPKYNASWARRGSSGYKVRSSSELCLGATTGIEIRTLTLPDDPSAQRALISFVSLFGTHLLHPDTSFITIKKQWQSIRRELDQILKQYDLPERQNWGNPSQY